MNIEQLQSTIKAITASGKGILAADESTGTITKRFKSINLESTEESRRAYRDLLFTTVDLEKYVSGIILFEETLKQQALDGTPFPKLLADRGIVPGIKVDKGLIANESAPEEKTTQGLDGLPERLAEYKALGARFAKWRVVYNVTDTFPSRIAIHINAEQLARYAAICQSQGIVPIVEPEVLMDGDHSIEQCAIATEHVLDHVFDSLAKHHVISEYIILKPSMVIAGKDHNKQASIEQVAEETIKILKRKVPAAVPTINFLSGGQSNEAATQHLNTMNQLSNTPWNLSFSYGRALQSSALKTWGGQKENVKAAQQQLLKRAQLNSLATLGKYEENME
ncbi:MAG: class I fructose-bisphosphate aldolase [Pseudomonadota bacterium]